MTRLLSFFDIEPILTPLQTGQLIITPNQRLASRIHSAYAIYCQSQGRKVVDAPQVYSLNNWLEQCWQRLLITADPLALKLKPLTLPQELTLWEQIVNESDLGAALLRPVATAQQAAAAYRLLVDWRLPVYISDSSEAMRQSFLADEDSAVLLTWIDQFEHRCADQGWLPSARRSERLLQAFEQAVLAPVGDCLGIGFEDIPPLQKAVLDAAGSFALFDAERTPAQVSVLECDSVDQEFVAAAVWAKQTLKNDPQASVAIVVPNLAQQRQQMQRVLLEVFDPGYNTPLNVQGGINPRRNLPFNFSAGYPLIEAPIIVAAMHALALNLQQIDLQMLEQICQSPFYQLGEADLACQSRLIALLREQREFTISSARFRQLADKVAASCDDKHWLFADALQQQATLSRAVANKQLTLGQWLPIISELLSSIGWPGSRTVDSIEYQQLMQWQQALDQLASLELVSAALGFNEVVALLRGIVSRQIFQPQTSDSALQVLGTLEAAGLQFSHIWLQSITDQQWPAAPAPNPLLPLNLQREKHMPHATADRELQYAKNLSHRFIHSAKHLIVSAPKVVDDNPAGVSQLFSQYPTITLEQLLGRSLQKLVPLIEIRRRHFEAKKLQTIDVGDAPPLLVDEKISGGVSLFASQSACPFRAFANHRLGLRALPEPEAGLNAADRGSLLHRALQLSWEKIKTQESLLALDDQQLQQLCFETSQYAVIELSQRKPVLSGKRFQQLEVQRLQQLIGAWLVIEKQRAAFVVEGTESRQQFEYKQLKLETRIDRIDRMTDNSLLVIDYKTGNANVSQWWGDRPDAPQMPLYSHLLERTDDQVGAIAFAQLHTSGCSFKGVGDEAFPEPALKWQDKTRADAGELDWQQLKLHWEKVLSVLADDFIAGKSAVDPKHDPATSAKTCQYCDLSSVCRVNHQELLP